MNAINDLIGKLISQTRARHPDRPALIGVGGAQGSGKSFHCRAYAAAHEGVAHFSLDDVYLTKAEREALARQAHPLFITRGAPGTHDLDLAAKTISALERAAPETQTLLPRFDKSKDDRAPCNLWPAFIGRPAAVLVDGWCFGARASAKDPAEPNLLEAREDQDGVWRALVQDALCRDYACFFAAFDCIIYLKAPCWEIVRVWRGEQEQETLGRALTAKEHAALDRFVMHYERVTRDMLAGHHGAHWIVRLDESRRVIGIEER